MSNQAKFDEFLNSKEYKVWSNLKDVMDSLGISQNRLVDIMGQGDLNEYWEPFLDRIFKLGVTFKQTGKLKELRMNWIRPIFFMGMDYAVTIDGVKYEPFMEAVANGRTLYSSLGYLVEAIGKIGELTPQTFKKQKKDFQDLSKAFFGDLNKYIKIGFRELRNVVKQVLKPFRDLRRANFNYVCQMFKELGYEELYFLAEKKGFKDLKESVKIFFQNEEVRLKRDPDPEKLNDYLAENLYKNEYVFQLDRKVEKCDFKANTFRMDIYQQKWEETFNLFLKYLYEKMKNEFYIAIDVHKMFRNIEIPCAKEIPPLKFYIDMLVQYIFDIRVELFEMKMNSLNRTKMPIVANVEFIEMVRKIYDMHIIIEMLMGDKLKQDQYVFIYKLLKFVFDSTQREQLILLKSKEFMEIALPKYCVLSALIYMTNIHEHLKEIAKDKNEPFSYDSYIQIKMPLECPEAPILNAHEIIGFVLNDDLKKQRENFHKEINEIGRFWIFEGLINPTDKNLWMEGIDQLRNLNKSIQEDIRDMILLQSDGKKINISGIGGDKNKDKDLNSSRRSSRDHGTKKLTSQNSLKKDIKEKDKERDRSNSGKKKIVPSNIKKKPGVSKEKEDKTKNLDESFETEDGDSTVKTKIKNQGANVDLFRPPYVWNFPYEKIKKHTEDERIELRNTNPRTFYKDGRVDKFLELLEEVTKRSMTYCKDTKGGIWDYIVARLLPIFQNMNNILPK